MSDRRFTEVLIPYSLDRVSGISGIGQCRQPTSKEWESAPEDGTVLENVEVRRVGRMWRAKWGAYESTMRSASDAARNVGAEVARSFQNASSASRKGVWELGRLRESRRRVTDTRNLSVYTPPAR